jgi:SAM-dependent methyltransferase
MDLPDAPLAQSPAVIGPWPPEQLEDLGSCPACGARQRAVLYRGLTDGVFRCAPGAWTLYRCLSCRSAYLDPRPTAGSIGAAYARYYTHEYVPRPKAEALGSIPRLLRALANGYRNHRFGTRERPASRLGVIAAWLFFWQRSAIDAQWRHLPRTESAAAILDVGAGNGAFLRLARRAGWAAVGVEPDRAAAAVARDSGLDVHQGGLEVFDGRQKLFDTITLSHVIEHVHDPLVVLAQCHRLLKRGGRLWIETPNIDSYGRRLFGPAWRGLEAPRHLVLFNEDALRDLLHRAGFVNVRTLPYRPLSGHMFQASHALAQGRDPYAGGGLPGRLRLRALWFDLCAWLGGSGREFVTLSASRPA